MLSEKENQHFSKLLSFILRHHPESAGVELDANGWTDTSLLVKNINAREPGFNLEILQFIMSTNSKKRFGFNEDGSKIRANQGHSIEIQLQLPEREPPETLFHGTAEKNIPSILQTGLQKIERHHVHLSVDRETAKAVGARYGKPVVLTVQSGKMHSEGYKFYLSDNAVWLTEAVPPAFLPNL
jgi:putative RNA 2'-phosphotransferase